MDVLVVNAEEVERLLPMEDCIRLMEEALSALAEGKVLNPLRSILRLPEGRGLLGLMPAYQGGAGAALGLKAVCVFPDNQALGRDTHQGAVLLFSAETGELQALLNASAITAIRTAAVSAVATRHLARPEAGDLGIIGSGVQARWHLEAMATVRTLRRVRVTSRNAEHARRLAAENSGRVPVPIEVVPTVEDAIRGADLIVTATAAREPIVRSTWISAGAHLNVVGASAATAREVDTLTVQRAALFVDRRESALNEAGEYLLAVKEAGIGPDHIRAELGEVLLGQKAGRTSAREITMFKSVGLAVEDLAAARYLHEKANREGGAGRRVSY
jgi:ornithine cyclodeaminase/alanine dehydrogenase-like protein (mu-crystallin family)